MESSYKLIPTTDLASVSIKDTANSFGLHDSIRHGGPRSLGSEIGPKHPLQARLENWDETQANLKLTMERNIYGIHAPVRKLMERKLVSQKFNFPGRPQSNLHLDILMGNDELISISDVFIGDKDEREPLDIRAEMEKQLKLI